MGPLHACRRPTDHQWNSPILCSLIGTCPTTSSHCRSRATPPALVQPLAVSTDLRGSVFGFEGPSCYLDEALIYVETLMHSSVRFFGSSALPSSLVPLWIINSLLAMAAYTPHCLHTFDVKRNGKNYNERSSNLRVLLVGLHLWGHINGTKPAPSSLTSSDIKGSSSQTSSRTSNPSTTPQALEKWFDGDSHAFVIYIHMNMCNFLTAKESSTSHVSTI